MVNRFVYVARNAWEVRGVVYTNEVLAQDAARRAGAVCEQLYRKLDNPEWQGEEHAEQTAELD